MKLGLWVILLGILGVIIGGAMYGVDWHRTIGLSGVAVGIILLVLGGVMYMREGKPAPPMKPTQTA